ncbi:MAG: hypothetical protein RJA22_3086 [Verrucomicrobiota bacterium]
MSNNASKNPNDKNAPAAKSGGAPAKPAATSAAVPASPAVTGPLPALFRRVDWLSCLVTFLVTFAAYLYTLAPDLTLEDCGELAVGSYYAGVPHPPGYPVWTVYTWIFTWLVPVSNIAYRVAISSAFAGALSCGFVALMVSRGSSLIIEGLADLKNTIDKHWENALCLVCGWVAGLLIGFNGFMWSQSVIVEVYTLSVLSMTGVMACLMRWIYAPHQYRFLYLSFFWFGITFNNHQSLLVIILGMEAAIIAASARMGRNLLFWNVLGWLGGIFAMTLGMASMLRENGSLLLIFHLIGFSSFIGWLILLVSTRIKSVEILRDVVMVAALGYVGVLLLAIMGWTSAFEGKTSLFVLFNLVGLGLIGAFIHLTRKTWKMPREWAVAVGCWAAGAAGAACYIYMPLASMSNPPLNWGYPRTVQGFFHAFTRGQYERINPTFGQSGNIAGEISRYLDQIMLYVGGCFEEMNFVYVLIGLIPLFFIRRLQPRERAWIIGLAAIYFCLSFFLLNLLNPAPDRQSRDLNRVFFTASHVLVAMGVGYGLAILGAYLSTAYERFRRLALYGTLGAAGVALFMLAVRFQGEKAVLNVKSYLFDLDPSLSPLVRFTCLFSLALALAAVAIFALGRQRLQRTALLGVMVLMPLWSVLSHWYDNEQRGHYFGYWFGHDMFTPPFKDPASGKLSYDAKRREELLKTPEGRLIYPEMDRDTVLYGGTDPGRFNPTYMIFCESFIPPAQRNPQNPHFDRRDVYLITQNALADGTYLNYIRAHYNRSAQIDPPFFSELLRGPRELELNEKTNFLARLARPLDSFFLGLGDRIEKNRRVGSSFFNETNFLDLPAFAAKLKAAADPVSRFLNEQLSANTRQMLGTPNDALKSALAKDLNRILDMELANAAAWHAKLDEQARLERELAAAEAARPSATGEAATRLAAEAERLKASLARANTDLAALGLYDPARFQGVNLSARTRHFIAQRPRIHNRVRLNRLLLEETYPKELTRSLGGVYPDFEILTASNEDSQRAFQEYLQDAQKRLEHDRRNPQGPRQIRPGEDVKIIDNRVQVSGQVAVMAINGLLTKIIFDKNPTHEFYVEESFPLDWMYPHLTPYGIIMKINRNPLPELSQEIVDRDHKFWKDFSTRLIGDWIDYDTPLSKICAFAIEAYHHDRKPNGLPGDPNFKFTGDPAFLRDSDGQKAFSKLRSSIAGVYNWRITQAKSPAEQQRMIKEAEFAFKQAYAFCPYSPEALFRYVNLLVSLGRFDDALLLARTSFVHDPFNAQIENLISELDRIKRMQPGGAAAVTPGDQINAQLDTLEAQYRANPTNFNLGLQVAGTRLQSQQGPQAGALLDFLTAQPGLDAESLTLAANMYAQLGNVPKVEYCLQELVKRSPDNPEGRYDLAAILAMQNKSPEALLALSNALSQSANRRRQDPAAPHLYSNALSDPRFASLRPLPQFQSILDGFKATP